MARVVEGGVRRRHEQQRPAGLGLARARDAGEPVHQEKIERREQREQRRAEPHREGDVFGMAPVAVTRDLRQRVLPGGHERANPRKQRVLRLRRDRAHRGDVTVRQRDVELHPTVVASLIVEKILAALQRERDPQHQRQADDGDGENSG